MRRASTSFQRQCLTGCDFDLQCALTFNGINQFFVTVHCTLMKLELRSALIPISYVMGAHNYIDEPLAYHHT